jgi:hypothetical protein
MLTEDRKNNIAGLIKAHGRTQFERFIREYFTIPELVEFIDANELGEHLMQFFRLELLNQGYTEAGDTA